MRFLAEGYAIYKLLVPPPVTVEWMGYTQTLRVNRNPHRPFGVIEVLTGSSVEWSDHFDSGAHAEHVLANGWKVHSPGPFATIMDRLVRDGKAQMIVPPYIEQRLSAEELARIRPLDARYGFRGPQGENDKLV